jgi:hypothetical protein
MFISEYDSCFDDDEDGWEKNLFNEDELSNLHRLLSKLSDFSIIRSHAAVSDDEAYELQSLMVRLRESL